MKILVNRKINHLFLCLLLIMAVFTATAIIFIALKLENTVFYAVSYTHLDVYKRQGQCAG